MTISRLLPGVVAAALLLGGCAGIPADPDGTLARVRTDGVLRAGASPREPWVVLTDGQPPGGTEPALVEEFAERQGASVEWVVDGESALVRRLDDGELDLVVGGLTDDWPWDSKAALTRPYAEASDPRGRTEKHVMAVRMGENALLSELERFLDEVHP